MATRGTSRDRSRKARLVGVVVLTAITWSCGSGTARSSAPDEAAVESAVPRADAADATGTAEIAVSIVGYDAGAARRDRPGEIPTETSDAITAEVTTCTESAHEAGSPDPQRSAAWPAATNLGPAGTVELDVDLTDRPQFLGWRDDRLVVLAGDDSVVRSYCLSHDAATPLVLASQGRFAVHHADFPGRNEPAIAGDTVVHLSKDGTVVAAALPSLRVLWQQPVEDRSEMPLLAGTVRRRSDIVLLIADAPSTEEPVVDEAFGFALADGSMAWRRPVTSGSTLLAAGERAVLVDPERRVEGLADGSGDVAWTAETGLPAGEERFQFGSPHHVVVGQPGARLVVLDADTGAEVSSKRLPSDETFVPLAVLDDVLLATASWQDREGWQMHEVRAIDLATARVKWKSGRSFTRASEWQIEPVALVGIDDDVIYVYTPDDMLRVLDRATGEELASWRQAPEGCLVEPVLVRPVSTEPAMVLCLNRPTTVESLRCPMDMRPLPAVVTVLARVAEPPQPGWPVEEVTIAGQVIWRGRPKAGARVRVDDRRVRTDAEGRFRVTLEARGMVIVDALQQSVTRHDPNDVTDNGPRKVILDGRSEPYEVALEFDDCGGDCD